MTTVRVDIAIVGGGIVGLATAHRILEQRPDLRVVVLEREHRVGSGQSSRNSGVLHAGLYYAPGSAKARWSTEGKVDLERFCDEHGVPLLRCGKLVVAVSPSELAALDALAARARANGVQISELDPAACRELEPQVTALAGIHSPRTSVTDFGLVCEALQRVIEVAGGTIRLGAEVLRITQPDHGPVRIETGDGAVSAGAVVVCAGLQADRLARSSGLALRERIVPFRGSWLRVRAHRADVVSTNIYPVPRPGLPFLGVHLTPRIDGALWIGPNAVLAPAREGRRPWTVDARDLGATLGHRGSWRLALREWRVAASEVRRDLSLRAMMRAVRAYVPSLADTDVEVGPWGVRAQLVARDGRLVDDFRIVRDRRVLHVLNAPSPAATASLSIGAQLRDDALALL
jgi:(S)-2-hydroxyglutarate dehydrogenase